MPPDNDALGLYEYVGSLTRPVRYHSETVGGAAGAPDIYALGLYEYVGSLTRPVRYRSKNIGGAAVPPDNDATNRVPIQ